MASFLINTILLSFITLFVYGGIFGVFQEL